MNKMPWIWKRIRRGTWEDLERKKVRDKYYNLRINNNNYNNNESELHIKYRCHGKERN